MHASDRDVHVRQGGFRNACDRVVVPDESALEHGVGRNEAIVIGKPKAGGMRDSGPEPHPISRPRATFTHYEKGRALTRVRPRLSWSQRQDSNLQPAVYKTAALPLRHAGKRAMRLSTIYPTSEAKSNRYRKREAHERIVRHPRRFVKRGTRYADGIRDRRPLWPQTAVQTVARAFGGPASAHLPLGTELERSTSPVVFCSVWHTGRHM